MTLNTRFYLVRTVANQVLPGSPAGVVDTGYADGSHQMQFAERDANGNVIDGAGLADMMTYAQQNGELVFQVQSDDQAHQILTTYQQTGNAPTGDQPRTSIFASLPWWAWAGIAYLILREVL